MLTFATSQHSPLISQKASKKTKPDAHCSLIFNAQNSSWDCWLSNFEYVFQLLVFSILKTSGPVSVFSACLPPSQLCEALRCTPLLHHHQWPHCSEPTTATDLKHVERTITTMLTVEYVILQWVGAKSKVIFRLMKYVTMFFKMEKKD